MVDVTITNQDCGALCFHIYELATLNVTSVDVIRATEIPNTVFSGILSSLYVDSTTIQTCSGASVLKPEELSDFHFDKCLFTDNYALKDGPVLSVCHGAVEFKNSRFTSNSADGRGGAIFAKVDVGECSIAIKDSVFENNTATGGGALFIDRFESELNLQMENVSFVGNTARSHGGAWYTLARQRVDANFSSVTYVDNFAPNIPVRGTASATFIPYGYWSPLSVLTGASLPSFGVATIDAYEQRVLFELETAPVVALSLIRAADNVTVDNSVAALYGPTIGVIDFGNLTLARVPIFAGSNDVFNFTVEGRDALVAHLKAVYAPKLTVIYRDFSTSTSTTGLLARDAATSTLTMKYSLADATGNFLNSQQLKEASTVLAKAFVSPDTIQSSVSEGAIANTTLGSVGSVLVIAISCSCVIAVAVLATYVNRKAGPGTTNDMDICLAIKSFCLYARRKNKVALESEVSPHFRKISRRFICASFVSYIILVWVWEHVEAPTPQLLHAGSKRYWVCGGSLQTRFLGSLISITGTLLLAACKFSYETVKVGWPVPALEDRLLLVNAANMLATGVVAAGMLMAQMMDGYAQFVVRVTATYLVAAGMTGSFLGYKVFLLKRPAGDEEDAVDARIRAFAAVRTEG
ncbi:hypothetical protein HDU86_008312 [Geranomyces michiganensis]|nr:hypothetical protein HDU86_008312 [Geranomyces michiganensis]